MTNTKLTKESLGEALDLYVSYDKSQKDEALCVSRFYEAARRLYKHWDALEELDKAGDEATQGEWLTGYEGFHVDAEYRDNQDQNWHMKVVDVRGWGHLTGNGNNEKSTPSR